MGFVGFVMRIRWLLILIEIVSGLFDLVEVMNCFIIVGVRDGFVYFLIRVVLIMVVFLVSG